MIKLLGKISTQALMIACVTFAIGITAAGQRRSHGKNKPVPAGAQKETPAASPTPEPQIIGKKIQLADGAVIQADDVWQQGGEYWYRIGGVTQRVSRSVKNVEAVHAPVEKPPTDTAAADTAKPAAPDSFWIMLKGGARMKADDVEENEEGAWARRGNYSVLIARDRIERIERESTLTVKPGWKVRDWSTGNQKIDQLIKANGNRFGVDPYLVFCVIEHESQFRARAVSPKGARGLMQLMPGTAARFGVDNAFDPAENIYGGTRYLKELLDMFGRVDLALASYNAGEGAVIKYGGKVPPYRETREYVRRISGRYGVGPDRKQDKRSDSPE